MSENTAISVTSEIANYHAHIYYVRQTERQAGRMAAPAHRRTLPRAPGQLCEPVGPHQAEEALEVNTGPTLRA